MATYKQKRANALKTTSSREVLEMTRAVREYKKQVETILEDYPFAKNFDYLYVFENQGLFKIGTTFNIVSRHNSLQCGNPFPIRIVFAIKIRNCKELEAELHTIFKEKRFSREWFSLDDGDLDIIRELIRTDYV